MGQGGSGALDTAPPLLPLLPLLLLLLLPPPLLLLLLLLRLRLLLRLLLLLVLAIQIGRFRSRRWQIDYVISLALLAVPLL